MTDNIPEELKKVNKWICHKGKVPKNPNTGRNLTGGYEGWGTDYESAKKAVKKFKFDGLGFVFSKDNEYCGIDIDSCVVDGEISDTAKSFIDKCKSYTEFSPSKTGIHIITKHINRQKVLYKDGGVEIYTQDRYFTVTGDVVGKSRKIETANVEKILDDVVLRGKGDRQLLEKISGDKFAALWVGDATDYNSRSEADLALCGIIAGYTTDPEQIDRLFRMSGLFRPKWDRSVGGDKTYAEATINKALNKTIIEQPQQVMVVEMGEFKALKMPEIKMIMSPWLSYGSTHMIYAARGVGKTFFSLSLSMAVSHGTDFGEWEVHEPVNTMYVDGEMLPQHMLDRINGLEINVHNKVADWYILSSGLNLQNRGSAINIVKSQWQDLITNEVLKKNIKLLFLDNISALTPGIEENEASAWDNIAAWINKLKQTGCAIVLVHHAGKSGQQRGTSAREDALDTVIMLKRTTNDAMAGVDVDVVFEKSRHIAGAAVAPMGFRITQTPGTGELVWGVGQAGASKKERALAMVCDGRSYEDIKTELGIGKSTVTKYKKMAIENGWLVETERGIQMTKTGRTAIGGDYDF